MSAFADELRRAMTARHVTIRALALVVDVQPSAISKWRSGTVPMLNNADRLADALEWESLRTIAMGVRARRCARNTCRRRFFADDVKALYCGKTCSRTVQRQRRNGVYRARRVALVDRLQEAIAAHCNDCEPLGLCRDSTCQLRSVSPLPFVALTRRKVA